MPTSKSLIPVEHIHSRILLIRGQKVILDADLAEICGVPTKALNQAVRRNRDRFPNDFMFQLNREEFKILRSQIVASSGWGGRRYPPNAFTEPGAVMVASVLNSPRAIQVSVQVVRAYVKLRELLATEKVIKISHCSSKWRLYTARISGRLRRFCSTLWNSRKNLNRKSASKPVRINNLARFTELPLVGLSGRAAIVKRLFVQTLSGRTGDTRNC